eukprot:scaffold81622_cov36-Prasinocladus_malaysianus.AAC.1
MDELMPYTSSWQHMENACLPHAKEHTACCSRKRPAACMSTTISENSTQTRLDVGDQRCEKAFYLNDEKRMGSSGRYSSQTEGPVTTSLALLSPASELDIACSSALCLDKETNPQSDHQTSSVSNTATISTCQRELPGLFASSKHPKHQLTDCQLSSDGDLSSLIR